MDRFPPPRILVPIDFSEPSISALEDAKLLARSFGASLELLYVQTASTDPTPGRTARTDPGGRRTRRFRSDRSIGAPKAAAGRLGPWLDGGALASPFARAGA